MAYQDGVSFLASWSAILTAVLAVLAYGQFQYMRLSRRRRMEAYLKSVRKEGQGQKTVIHLMARLSMTENEVLTAGFHSARIVPKVKSGEGGMAGALLFQYSGG